MVKMFRATSASSFIFSLQLNLSLFKNLSFSPIALRYTRYAYLYVHAVCVHVSSHAAAYVSVCVCVCVHAYICVHARVCRCFVNCAGQSQKTESTNHNF